MAKTATATIAVTVGGDGLTCTQSFVAVNNTTAGPPVSVNLVTGNNTINIPSGAVASGRVMIMPPPGNVVALTLKGVAGDTGITINPQEASYLSLGASQLSFVVNASAGVTLNLYWC